MRFKDKEGLSDIYSWNFFRSGSPPCSSQSKQAKLMQTNCIDFFINPSYLSLKKSTKNLFFFFAELNSKKGMSTEIKKVVVIEGGIGGSLLSLSNPMLMLPSVCV
jgi:hypothetical protein